MADDIEIHYDPRRGELLLTCGNEAFARIRDAVIVLAGLEEAPIDGVPAKVHTIVVEEAGVVASPNRFRDKLAMLGCSLIGFAILFVIVTGLITIAGWF